MAVNLILSISQEEAIAPYQFKITNINVYSFEEALYHCYHYWKQSIDDFASEAFIQWVSETLKLSFLAAKIKDLAVFPSLSRKLSQFLALTDYFSSDQIEKLRQDVAHWENRMEWEKLKERGDYLMHQDDPEKAVQYYKKALAYGENKALLNNIAIALMKNEHYGEAIQFLNRALASRPADYSLSLHLAEAYIFNGNYGEADAVLKKLERYYGNRHEIQFFYGELSFAQGDYTDAIACYEKIIAESSAREPAYIYRLADAYVQLRYYDKALAALEKINDKDKYFLKKQADVYVTYNNIPAAIQCMETALRSNKNSVDLWVRLARYHRLNYDLENAAEAIAKALSLSPNSPHANLEHARIQKALGKTKEYQVILNTILTGFKENYRSNEYDANYAH